MVRSKVFLTLAPIIFAVIGICVFTVLSFNTTGANAHRNQSTRISLDNNNFYRYIYITKITSQDLGTRLHFFPENHHDQFENVIITYSIFSSSENFFESTGAIMLSQDGRGVTLACQRITPRIVRVTGLVITRTI